MIDIRTIDLVYLHGPHRPERREHMEKILREVNLKGECFIGRCDIGRRSGVMNMIEIFKKRLEGEFRPFVCLEDDCSTTPWFRHSIQVPEDADGVYIGISKWSLHPHFDKAIPVLQAEPVPDYPETVRLLNMLSNHAVLFLTKRWTQECLDGYIRTSEKSIPEYDWDQSRSMPAFRVYGLKRPLFYQDEKVGGQEDATLIQIQ